ncbi:MAG TPA: transglycosylase SLT domain-containing protein [Candidatus Manganitrophaceae bacterium]|nr:transglycosylase SLT domain-containing protein [Candidatus Manganitrophaceae bacterium]
MIYLLPTILFFVLSGPLDALSMEVFQYVDSAGTIHFSNVPTDTRYKRLQPGEKATFYIEKETRQKVEGIIEREARGVGIEPALIKAVVKAESDFDVNAVSSAGALGLMQLMPDTAFDLGLSDPFDPEENIRGGVRHIRYLLDLFNQDITLSLAAYHAGARNVMKYGKVPPFEETRLYVEKVQRLYRKYLGKSAPGRWIYVGHRPNGEIFYTNHPERYPQMTFTKFKE